MLPIIKLTRSIDITTIMMFSRRPIELDNIINTILISNGFNLSEHIISWEDKNNKCRVFEQEIKAFPVSPATPNQPYLTPRTSSNAY